MADDESDTSVPLESFLVACQRSLARSLRAAFEASVAEPDFFRGDRTLFTVQGVEFDVSAALSTDTRTLRAAEQSVRIDLQAPPALRSRLKFTVAPQVRERREELAVQVSNLDPLGSLRPTSRLRVWAAPGGAAGGGGSAVRVTEVEVVFAPAGGRGEPIRRPVPLDLAGRADLEIDGQGVVRLAGQQDSLAELRDARTWYVWAAEVGAAVVPTSWLKVTVGEEDG